MSSCIVFDERLTRYNFGESHPMAPVRVELTMQLADSLGLFGSNLTQVGAEPASDELLQSVHEGEYIEVVKNLSANPIETAN